MAKRNSTASGVVFSAYRGGSDWDANYGIAVDGSGNAYVTGFRYSSNFSIKNLYQPQRTPQTTKNAEISNAFVTKVAFN